MNGVPLTNDRQALTLMDKLKDADTLNLDILRKGRAESLSLSLR